MNLDDILSSVGPHKRRRRLGRGTGSGHGKTSGRGTKGAGARAGWHRRLGKEGGQNSMFARLPQRGFKNAMFRVDYQPVNVGDLERFDAGATVDPAGLAKANLISDHKDLVKVLGGGEITRGLTVVADKFSAQAIEKILKSGGKPLDRSGQEVKAPEPKPEPQPQPPSEPREAEQPKAKAKGKAKPKAEGAQGEPATEGKSKDGKPKEGKPKKAKAAGSDEPQKA